MADEELTQGIFDWTKGIHDYMKDEVYSSGDEYRIAEWEAMSDVYDVLENDAGLTGDEYDNALSNAQDVYSQAYKDNPYNDKYGTFSRGFSLSDIDPSNIVSGSDISDAAEDIYKDVIKPIGDELVDFHINILDVQLDAIDYGFEAVGVKGSVAYLQDITTGMKYIGHGILEGNEESIKVGLAVTAMVALTIWTGGITSPLLEGSIGAAISLALGLSSVYGLTAPFAAVTQALESQKAMEALMKKMQELRDSMNLNHVNSWINGSMNFWMAGGMLYDSPRAGDVFFTPDGHLGTTKFLRLEDKNATNWSEWNQGRYHDFSNKTFGKLAGHPLFSVNSMS